MAKNTVAFNKLKLKIDESVSEFDVDENHIIVRKYLPANEKLELVDKVINDAANEEVRFFNVLLVDIFFVLEAIRAYSNITITSKQMENPLEVYDKLKSSGMAHSILTKIPEEEISGVKEYLEKQLKALYEYNNSAFGILDGITHDYDNLKLDLNSLGDNIQKADLGTLKETLDKLG